MVSRQLGKRLEDARRTLLDRFGLKCLRSSQEKVLRLLLEPEEGAPPHAVAIFPTGGGKSLCYQLPALLFTEALTVVVSPLLALMKDQVDSLVQRGIPAATLNSTQGWEEESEIEERVRSNEIRLLYVSPERFKNTRFQCLLKSVPLALFACDEAHCVSQWGHSFRADYRRLAHIAKELPFRSFLALTATATPRVADSICEAFDIPQGCIVRVESARPNLATRITRVAPSGASTSLAATGATKAKSFEERIDMLASRLKERPPGATIVYVTLQQTAENVVKGLRSRGIEEVRPYHAGIHKDERAETQNWFIEGTGSRVMCATIAFGMGLDKSDVRYIYHFNLPKSLDGWQQEIGRAGRDGNASICETLACVDDIPVLRAFARGSAPSIHSVRMLVKKMFSDNTSGATFTFIMSRLAVELDIRDNSISQLICNLEIDEHCIRQVQPYFEKQVCELTADMRHRTLAAQLRPGSVEAKLFAAGKETRKNMNFDVESAAAKAGVEPWKVAGILTKLKAEGFFLHVKGSIIVSRIEVVEPIDDVESVTKRLHEMLVRNEKLELDQVDEVIDFFRNSTECHRKIIARKYGDPEPLDDCGQCQVTATASSAVEAKKFDSDLNSIEKLAFDEKRWHRLCTAPIISNALVLARVACGINSPLITKNKYKKLEGFGSMTDHDYSELLKRAQQFCSTGKM